MLKKYLEQNNCGHLFTEYDNHGFLNKSSKKQMVQNVTSYSIHTHSLRPKYEEIVDVCSAAIELFPAYRTTPSTIGGIVCILFSITTNLIVQANGKSNGI